MGRYFVYLKLELKRALKTIPYLLLGAIMLMVFIGIIAFCAGKLLYNDALIKKVQVGVVIPKEDSLSQMAVQFLSSMDSVESLCEFITLEEEEALNKLKKREIYAVLAVPSSFVQHIIDGTNTSVIVILPEHLELEAALLKELTDAGALSLGAAQAGIYAANYFFNEHGMANSLAEAEGILNQIYLSNALNRSGFFDRIPVSAMGDMSVMEYYVISSIVLFLLLCGIPCSFVLNKRPKALQSKLRIIGIRSSQIVFTEIASVFLLLVLTFFGIGAAIFIICGLLSIQWISLSILGLISLLFVIAAISTVIVFIYKLVKNPIEGILLLFISSIAMLFLSGGILPIQFLPSELASLSPYVPTTMFMELAGAVITNIFSWQAFIKNIAIMAIFYISSAALYSREV